jgi:hypothetical protein
MRQGDDFWRNPIDNPQNDYERDMRFAAIDALGFEIRARIYLITTGPTYKLCDVIYWPNEGKEREA